MSDRPGLDLFGLLEGTDKSSANHGYLDNYEVALAPMRDKPITLVEIGVLDGASLRMWRRFFPKATIVGIDIHASCKAFEGDGTFVEIGSQDDPAFLNSVFTRYHPDVIIDDGSHRADHILYTLQCAYPHLNPGGIYIIEDLFLHYSENAEAMRGPGTDLPLDLLLDLARSLVAGFLRPSEAFGFRKYLFEQTQALKFFRRAALLEKKPDPQALDIKFDRMRAYAEERSEGGLWLRVCDLATQLGRYPQAEAAARQASIASPTDARVWHRLASSLNALRQYEPALAAIQQCLTLDPNLGYAWVLRGELALRSGRMDDAEKALRRALELDPRSTHAYRFLAEVQERRGEIPQAMESLSQAISIAGTGFWAESLTTALTRLRAEKDKNKA